MSISNKVMVDFILREGCSQDEGEVEKHWTPLFSVYDDLFIDLFSEAFDEWLSENRLRQDVVYQVIFAHRVERDGAGAVHSEYFEPIHVESQFL